MIRTNRRNKNQSAFTLIELLVVISIIGLLASMMLLGFNNTVKKARDVRRDADIRQLITALSIYYDNYGHYPCKYDTDLIGGVGPKNPDFLKPLVQEGLIATAPHDPYPPRYYTYSTYKSDPYSPCGQIAHFDIDYELPHTTCGAFGQMMSDIHCHIFFPNPPCDTYVHDACTEALIDYDVEY